MLYFDCRLASGDGLPDASIIRTKRGAHFGALEVLEPPDFLHEPLCLVLRFNVLAREGVDRLPGLHLVQEEAENYDTEPKRADKPRIVGSCDVGTVDRRPEDHYRHEQHGQAHKEPVLLVDVGDSGCVFSLEYNAVFRNRVVVVQHSI